MAFEVDQIRLNGHYDTDTGKVRTANVYWVDGIDRALTIAELVMAICLERAATMEEGIIEIMREMQDTNLEINALTLAETIFVGKQDNVPDGLTFKNYITEGTVLPSDVTEDTNILSWLSAHGVSVSFTVEDTQTKFTKDQIQSIITSLESKLDNLNSYSQQKMIELQSETNKRNQAYDLISSMVKSIGTANQAISANYR